tara:strand:+ start:233 stop:2197 length:1965 start_codon:yes stop_codon:yes gene_type:complete
MALAIYEGTKKDQLVDENIDEEILRLLGLENVNDLDYDEYKTLLKERLAAGRMPGNKISRGEDQKLVEEFRRVKKGTGKFKVKNNKINFNSVTNRTTKKSRPTSRPTKRLMGSSVEPEGVVQVQSGGLQDVMEKVAPRLSKIENSLENILGSLTNQQKLQNKDFEKGRVSGEKEKKKEREEKSENSIFKKLGDGAKKIALPLGGIFDAIKKFFMAILGGIATLGLVDLFTDPKKFFRNLANGIIDFFNGVIESIFNIVINPINDFINNINESIFDGFVNNLNKALNFIDFLDVIPQVPSLNIPLIPLLQIPRIEPPEAEPEPMKAAGMDGGGRVTTDTGSKISSMGSDTQLVALTPGEVVMSKKAVDAYGADTLLGMNASAGGTNRPKMGMVPGYQNGGMVGGSEYGSEHIKTYAQNNGITDPTELAMFMAQMGHESGSFRYATEMASGEAYNPGTSAGKNLGNTQPGDGPRFKGRGYIQLTGRWNYGHFGKKVGVDLISNPELAASPDVAAAIAVQFYKDRVDRVAARRGDVAGATKGINPGLNGLKDRERRFKLYMEGQTPTGDVKGSSSSLQMPSPQSTPTSIQSSTQRPMIGVPGGGSGGSSVVVAGGGGAQQQAPSSAGGGAQSSSPMFSPIDQNNPDLLVIKSIYSIV